MGFSAAQMLGERYFLATFILNSISAGPSRSPVALLLGLANQEGNQAFPQKNRLIRHLVMKLELSRYLRREAAPAPGSNLRQVSKVLRCHELILEKC